VQVKKKSRTESIKKISYRGRS